METENTQSSNLKCYCCKSPFNEQDAFCGTCGYPFKASREEQLKFSSAHLQNKIDKERTQEKVKQARIVLFVLSGFTVIAGFIQYYGEQIALMLVINLILAGIYAFLGFWAKKKAFPAILTGTLIYISIILLNAVFEPLTLVQGIIFKIIFIAALMTAAYGAYKFKIDKV